MSISLASAELSDLANSGIDDLASSTLSVTTEPNPEVTPGDDPVVPVEDPQNESGSSSEYRRFVHYSTNPSKYICAFNDNVYLCIYKDDHFAQNALINGYDVHFQSPTGQELSFELVGYSNGTGAWWVHLTSTCYYHDNNLMSEWGTNSIGFYVLYGDSSRNTDNSSSQIWWDDSQIRTYSPNETYSVVIHSTYEGIPDGGSPGTVQDPRYPEFYYTYDNSSYSNDPTRIRELNSAYFNGRPSNHPMQINDSLYNTTFPIHIGRIKEDLASWVGGTQGNYINNSFAADPSLSITSSGGLHIPTNEEDAQDTTQDHIFSQDVWNTILIGVCSEPGGFIGGSHGSAQYYPRSVIAFCDLHIFARGTEYIMYVDGQNSTPIVVPSTQIDMHGNTVYPPQLLIISRQWHQNDDGYKWTSYDATLYDGMNASYGWFSTITKEGWINESVLPKTGVYIDYTVPEILKPQNNVGLYDTNVHRMELLCGYNAGLIQQFLSPNGNLEAQFAWEMLFRQNILRTIGNVEETVVPSTNSLPFIHIRPRTYQGLAGGCN